MKNINNIKYISSNLEILEERKERNSSVRRGIDSNNSNNNQLVIDSRVYLPLSLAVYGWLRQQMDKAHTAYKVGKLVQDSWDSLRQKFYPVHDWAIEVYGKKAIEEVLETAQKNPFAAIEQTIKQPATERRYPPVGKYSQFRFVLPKSIAQVDAIRETAITLGWTESALYQNQGKYKFPCGNDYGVVCYLDKDKHIGEVTKQYIEIIGTSSNALRFYNQDVEQPWITTTG